MRETKLEIRLASPRFPSWLLVALAAMCWLVGLEHRLDHGTPGGDP